MHAKLYRPAKTAMSSGTAKSKKWVLEFDKASRREIDPLMGWTGSSDTQSQVRLSFDSQEDAMAYAEEQGLQVNLQTRQTRAQNIRPNGYADNFATDRRTVWTH